MFVLFVYKENKDLTKVKLYLGNDSKWYIGTSDTKKFASKQTAKIFYQSRECVQPIACQVLIEGPRGGVYRMSEV